MTTLEPKTGLRASVFLNLLLHGNTLPFTGGPAALTLVLLSAVHSIDEQTLRRVAGTEAGVAFQPKTLLAVLSFCYARQIYSSGDVEDLMRRDEQFRELCGGEFPSSGVFRRFRRYNRDALESCLTAVLRFLAKPNSGDPGWIAASESDLRAEAHRRICTAAFIDGMEDQ